MLRTFGYNDALELASTYARPSCPVPVDAVAEPSPSAITFLTRLFNQHDLDGGDALEQQQLELLFATAPGVPWQRDVLDFAASKDHHTSLAQFICLWRCVCLHSCSPSSLFYLSLTFPPSICSACLRACRYLCWLDPPAYLETLAYLGYCLHASSSVGASTVLDAIRGAFSYSHSHLHVLSLVCLAFSLPQPP